MSIRLLEPAQRFPQAWHPITEDNRSFRLHRFPYGVIYSVEGEDILVLAIAHLHRKPDCWQDRLAKQ